MFSLFWFLCCFWALGNLGPFFSYCLFQFLSCGQWLLIESNEALGAILLIVYPRWILTSNIFHFSKCTREGRWVCLYVGTQLAPPSLLFFSLSRCLFCSRVMSGGVHPPARKLLWSPTLEQCVGADLSLLCSQVVALKSHRAHQQCDEAPRSTAISTTLQPSRCSRRRHICLNSGIKLGWRKLKMSLLLMTESRNVEEKVTYFTFRIQNLYLILKAR